MSLKFAGIPSTQKPPAVCKKSPPPDAIPLPPFVEKIFQGYCQWFDPIGTDRISLAERVSMLPVTAVARWEGSSPGSPYNIHLLMEYFAALDACDYTITLLLNGTPVGQRFRSLLVPRAIEPFDSGLIDFVTYPSTEIIQARIMS